MLMSDVLYYDEPRSPDHWKQILLVPVLICTGSAWPEVTFGQVPKVKVDAPAFHYVGRVLDAQTRVPIADAQVTAAASDQRQPGPSALPLATTDQDGRFALTVSTPNPLRIKIERKGYVAQDAGTRRPGLPGKLYTAGGSELNAVDDVLLMKVALIGGLVVDEEDVPLPGVVVRMELRDQGATGTSIRMRTTATTDLLGRFVIPNLRPGKYMISAGPPVETPKRSRPVKKQDGKTYVRTYFPSGTSQDMASTVEIFPGQQLEGIRIAMEKSDTFLISGEFDVLGASGIDFSRMSLGLWEDAPAGYLQPFLVSNGYVTEGRFEFRDVVPGSYTITAGTLIDGYSIRFGQQRIVLVSSDLKRVRFPLSLPHKVNGIVEIDGRPDGTYPANIRFQIVSSTLGTFNSATTTVSKGMFSLPRVSADVYQLKVTNLPSAKFVKSIFVDDVIMPQHLVTITNATQSIRVVLGVGGPTLRGVVSIANKPLSNSPIYAIPLPIVPATGFYVRKQISGEDGSFVFSNLPPGEYSILSLDEIVPGDLMNEQSLGVIAASGTRISLSLGQDRFLKLTYLENLDR